MGSWTVFDWIGYGTLSVAALMLALGQAAKESEELKVQFAPVIKTRWWNYFPLILMIASGISFLLRSNTTDIQSTSPTISLPSTTEIPKKRTEAVSARAPKQYHLKPTIAATLPASLEELSNDDLRSLTYTLGGQETEFSKSYYSLLSIARWADNGNDLRPPEQLAAIQLELDTEFNRIFRSEFKMSFVKVHDELIRRTHAQPSDFIPFGNGIIDPADADNAANDLVNLAKKLP